MPIHDFQYCVATEEWKSMVSEVNLSLRKGG